MDENFCHSCFLQVHLPELHWKKNNIGLLTRINQWNQKLNSLKQKFWFFRTLKSKFNQDQKISEYKKPKKDVWDRRLTKWKVTEQAQRFAAVNTFRVCALLIKILAWLVWVVIICSLIKVTNQDKISASKKQGIEEQLGMESV